MRALIVIGGKFGPSESKENQKTLVQKGLTKNFTFICQSTKFAIFSPSHQFESNTTQGTALAKNGVGSEY